MFAILAIVISVFYLASFSGGTTRKSIEVTPPVQVYDNKFLCHPEAWNSVFQNVSSIPEFWSATIPTSLAEKSIPEIAQMFGANVYANNAEYAYCYIAVPENNYGALNQTLTELGFDVKDVVIIKPEQ